MGKDRAITEIGYFFFLGGTFPLRRSLGLGLGIGSLPWRKEGLNINYLLNI